MGLMFVRPPVNIDQSPWQTPDTLQAPHRPAKRPLRIKLYLMLMSLDVSCVVLGFFLGALIRFGDLGVDNWLGVTASVVALFTLSAVSSGAYSLDVLRSPSRGTARAIGSLLTAFALLFLMFYFLKVDQQVSRIMTASSFLIALAAIAFSRQLVGDWIHRLYRGSFTTEVMLVDGVMPPPCGDMIVIDAQQAQLRPDRGDAAMQIRMAELLQGVDRVVVSSSRGSASAWTRMLKSTGTQGEILLRDFQRLAPIGVSSVEGRTTLVVSSGPLNARQRAVKRTFDLVLSAVMLFLLLPVFAVVALAIKLDSRGPVFFKQPRVGEGNALFKIYKFRTMSAAKTDLHGHQSARRDDDRLTRVGRLLRRTSIDELPQLINVLLGSRSIVGPRPHALGSLAGEELFWQVDQRYWERHVLKPGITGLAQVRGHRGATHTREHLVNRLQADLEYVSGWSLWKDVTIITRTVRVLTHPDAY